MSILASYKDIFKQKRFLKIEIVDFTKAEALEDWRMQRIFAYLSYRTFPPKNGERRGSTYAQIARATGFDLRKTVMRIVGFLKDKELVVFKQGYFYAAKQLLLDANPKHFKVFNPTDKCELTTQENTVLWRLVNLQLQEWEWHEHNRNATLGNLLATHRNSIIWITKQLIEKGIINSEWVVEFKFLITHEDWWQTKKPVNPNIVANIDNILNNVVERKEEPEQSPLQRIEWEVCRIVGLALEKHGANVDGIDHISAYLVYAKPSIA